MPQSVPAHIRFIVLQLVVRAAQTTDDLAGIALHSDLFAFPTRRPSRRGEPGGQASQATSGSLMKATPSSRGCLNEWLGQAQQEGGADETLFAAIVCVLVEVMTRIRGPGEIRGL
ncbi:hypothetical protein GCM10015535_64750 [Streptomyces gelaticus]|uniref:Uncharacterized protein n=1 Tax=Streptomyces gelaticus TaxID=285446 RepID=A0ABQ2W8X3_9ACTN|nr:hypothetical protein GCM10015535_64750 [Streptomyces gelaticus]